MRKIHSILRRGTAIVTAAAACMGCALPAHAVSQDPALLDPILEEIITDDMTEYEKLYAITQYTAENYSYTNEHVRYQHWYEMIEYGGGDCWANTDMIHMLCDKAGIKNIRHDGSLWDGASGHINLIALIDGEYYKAEAGTSGEKPRTFWVSDLGALPFSSKAQDGEVTLTRYYGFEPEFVIPQEVDGVPLTTIRKYAFSTKQLTNYSTNNSKLCYQFWKWDFSKIESVTIPETVTTISERAFFCSMLKTVTIPASVTVLPESAFYYSENLQSVTLPATITEIGENAFGACSALTDVWFAGTRAEWDAITIAEGNDALLNAEIHTADDSVIGDVNQDGAADQADAALLQAYLLTEETALPAAEAADLNADGVLDARDLTLLKRAAIA
ncbi:MAG: leucine-rich repeat protein [Oscillospiraceae bacterium]|nr:leucine-rich repeat protein [Oscillospiraceae bacterium]